jgi:hypothetical protein
VDGGGGGAYSSRARETTAEMRRRDVTTAAAAAAPRESARGSGLMTASTAATVCGMAPRDWYTGVECVVSDAPS